MYGDRIHIQDINGQTQVKNTFTDYYNDGLYIIIDMQSLGETIGREILDDYGDTYGEIDILSRIETITDDIRNDIIPHVEEYLNNNTE